VVTAYIDRPVGQRELRDLRHLAVTENARFFKRNPHLIEPYANRLIGVALCKGAALQYLGCGYGVKDFDVHFFYLQNPAKPRLSRTVKRLQSNVGSFADSQVDFIRTVIPFRMAASARSRWEVVQEFLRNAPTSNASFLAKKGVVGLLPEDWFARLIWCPTEGLEKAYREMADDIDREREAEEWCEGIVQG
jgi:hypothetical protein